MIFDPTISLGDLFTLLAILVAPLGKDFIDWLRKPKLKLSFEMNDISYFHKIPFLLGHFAGKDHYSEGFNLLLKISNPSSNH
jgi:hypothetical protein